MWICRNWLVGGEARSMFDTPQSVSILCACESDGCPPAAPIGFYQWISAATHVHHANNGICPIKRLFIVQ